MLTCSGTLREAFDLAERRIFQLLGQQRNEMRAARVVAGEGLAEAFDGASR